MAITAPTMEQLGALMRARTKVRGGVELGYFQDESAGILTRPTATEVLDLLAIVRPEVELRLAGIGEGEAAAATTALTYRLAQAVELGFWPEQNDGDESVAAQYGKLFDSTVAAIDRVLDGKTPNATIPGFGSIKTLGRDGLSTPAS